MLLVIVLEVGAGTTSQETARGGYCPPPALLSPHLSSRRHACMLCLGGGVEEDDMAPRSNRPPLGRTSGFESIPLRVRVLQSIMTGFFWI